MKAVLVAVLVGAAFASEDNAWDHYKNKFGKTYNNAEEERARFSVWQKNVEHNKAENSKGHDYVLGENQFSDQTSREFAAMNFGFIKPKVSELYGGVEFLGNHTYNDEALSDSVDWSTNGAVTPIKDQGHCGSCWIFSAVGAMESAYQIASGKLVSLAEQQVLDCLHNILPPTLGCKGGSMSPVFNYAKSHAICTTASYPYEAKAGKCGATSCTTGMPQGKVTGYKGLAPVAKLIPASYKAMMSAVMQQPVSVSIEADKDVFHQYTSGVVTGACGQMPDHGVLVVGYGTDPKLGDYWKIKNSWGASWGEKGFVRVKRGGSWRGECAILNSPSYPVVSKSLGDVVV